MNTQCSLREVYTVHANSRNVADPSSNVNFVCQLDIPLRNIVKAELLILVLEEPVKWRSIKTFSSRAVVLTG